MDSAGRAYKVRALLDPGSEVNLVSTRIVQWTSAPQKDVTTTLRVIGGGVSSTSYKAASLTILLKDPPAKLLEISALVLPELGITSPRFKSERSHWDHLVDLEFADPSFLTPRKVEILLGAECYARILQNGIRQGSPGEPTAQRTALGWIVFGEMAANPPSDDPMVLATTDDGSSQLESLLRNFWEIEEVQEHRQLSAGDLECERIFKEGYTRDETGRYVVRLPLKHQEPLYLQETILPARRSLQSARIRMRRDPNFAKDYRHFLQEYELLQHMSPLDGDVCIRPGDRVAYLPHHGIWQEADQSKKLRVVFNASSKTSNGTSLNDHLHSGPTLQTGLMVVFLWWRLHRFVISADIEKMYRQIRVDPRDVDLQRIVWEDQETGGEKHYRLLTLTYGMTCAPYLALRVLQQLVKDEGDRFPNASEVLRRSTYVDDIFGGADDLATAQRLRDELIQLLGAGGFPLKKWVSNHPGLIDDLPAGDRLRPKWKDFECDRPVKALGIAWDPSLDEFRYRLPASLDTSPPTKRSILSVIARLFDPLGWLSPVLITPKILMQDLWRCKLGWDDELPPDLQARWMNFLNNLSEITKIHSPRWVGTTSSDYFELHGFADASQVAYAATVYLKVTNESGTSPPQLIVAKTRVAPVKVQTIPRLELCGAALLAKLLHQVKAEYGTRIRNTYAWSDSSVVLAWLSGDPSRWPTFVANRVAHVQRDLPEVNWRHVQSQENPADLASRGVDPQVLRESDLWWNGPSWLAQSSEAWPQQLDCHFIENRPIPAVDGPNETFDFTLRCSSLEPLLQSTARFLRWTRLLHPESRNAVGTPLTVAELSQAYARCVNYIQKGSFEKEIAALKKGHSVSRTSPLRSLNPFLDTNGTIRVGGRLHEAQLPYNQRHPVILPKGCHLGELVIARAHRTAMHGGPTLTYAYAIRDTWIIGGRVQVRAYVRRCVTCARARARPLTQVMGNKPPEQLIPSKPFSKTGLDYAGPFHLKAAKGRGVLTTKGYLAIFVCMVTKAVHIEVVGDLTTASFLGAMRRFSSRRGEPTDLWSDNATTFHGADAELRALLRESEIQWGLLPAALALEGITWHFIPPVAPHFGGLWEAAVKSAKSHLKKTIGPRALTYEEMTTLTTLIERCLNSRPLTALTGDSDDRLALTPHHLLTGYPPTAHPEPATDVDENLDHVSHWRRVKALRDQFWISWSRDYLHTLQQRNKWQRPQINLRVDDVVLIRDPSLLQRGRWPLARVTAVHPGRDGQVRVATVRNQLGEYVRPITKLCYLPVIPRV